MYKFLLLLLLPVTARSQIIYGLQHYADGVQLDKRIKLPQDSSLHTGSHLVWISGVTYGLGLDGNYHPLGIPGAGGTTIPWDSVTGKPTFSAVAYSGSFASLVSKPSTLSGYGITDGVAIADTANRWIGFIFKSHDSVFYCKGNICYFSFKDTAGGSSPIDTSSLSDRINLKIDSIRRRADSVFWYANGTENFAYDSARGGGLASRFGVSGEDDAATQTRHFTANGHDISIDFDGSGNNGILFDHTASVASLFYNIVGTGSSTVDVSANGAELAWYDFGSSSFGDVVAFMHNGIMRLSAYKGVAIVDDFTFNGSTTPATSAVVDIRSIGNNKGLLIPRLTTTQMNAMSSVTTGTIIFNTTTNGLWDYNGSSWAAERGSSGLDTTSGDARYIKKADSATKYVTIKRLADTAAALRLISGGTLTGNLKRNDSLFSVAGVTNTYFGRDSTQWGLAKSTVFTATTSSARNDANSMLRLPDGTLIIAWSGFGHSVGDNDSAAILWAKSYDQGHTWTAPDTAVHLVAAGSYIPSLALRKDGTVVMLYLYQPTVATGNINMTTLAAPYNFGAWTTPTTVYNPGLYQSPASDRILITKSGAWLYPTCYPTTVDHGSAGGNYYIKILKSVNEGATWSALSYQIASPDSLAVEPGLYQTETDAGGVGRPPIYCYWRNRSGYVGMAVSSDTAISFGTPFPTNLFAPNATTSIKYIEKYRTLIAAHNKHDVYSGDAINGTSGRYLMQLSVSPNEGVDWFRQAIVDSTTGYYFFEPSVYWDSAQNEIMISYSRFNNAGSLCNLYSTRIPIYHVTGTADIREQNDLLITPSYNRTYSVGGLYGHQGLDFIRMTQKEIGGNNIGSLGTGDYLAFSQANSSPGRFAALIKNKTGSINSGMSFETTTKAETGSAPFQFSAIDSGASNVSGAFPATSQIFSVLNNYLNTGLGFFIYGSGETDIGANNTSTYLNIYNNVLGKTNAFFKVMDVTSGNSSYAPWFKMKGNNTPYGMTWDCNTSTNAPYSSFWIDGNNAGAAIANASSLFRVDNNGAASPAAATKVRLQLLGDGRLATNTLAPTAMFTIQGNTTQSQLGANGWRSSFLTGKYTDNVTGNGNSYRVVASDASLSDTFNTTNTVTYTNAVNRYIKGSPIAQSGLTITSGWGLMVDSAKTYLNGNLNLHVPPNGSSSDSLLVWSSMDSTVKKIDGTTLATIAYGNYLPTATGLTNVASVAADSASWTKSGPNVTGRVSGTLTETLANTGTVFTLTAPVTNVTWNGGGGSGTGSWLDVTTGVMTSMILYFSSATVMTVQTFAPVTTNGGNFVITFQYDAR